MFYYLYTLPVQARGRQPVTVIREGKQPMRAQNKRRGVCVCVRKLYNVPVYCSQAEKKKVIHTTGSRGHGVGCGIAEAVIADPTYRRCSRRGLSHRVCPAMQTGRIHSSQTGGPLVATVRRADGLEMLVSLST